LAYLLHRRKVGDMNFDVPCVISNHEDLRSLVEWYGIPYHYVPVPKDPTAKQAALEKTAQIIGEAEPDTIVLARYMQSVSPELCKALEGRMINIHHSFLPGFKGASPYRQAHERGVKLIGATAHFVTTELDEGPIIEQNVVRVDHSHSAEELRAIGQDEESRTLTQAVRWFAEHRILLDGVRTIIFK